MVRSGTIVGTATAALVALQVVSGRSVPIPGRPVVLPRAGGAYPGSVLAGAPVSNITITPAGVVQCAWASVSWSGATDPVDLSIGTGGYYIGTTHITTLYGQSGGEAWWQVNQPAGTDLIFQVTDANGYVGYIQNIKVQGSDDGSCLSTSGDAAAGADSDGSTAAAVGTTSTGKSAAVPATAAPTGASTMTASGLTAHKTSSSKTKTSKTTSATSTASSGTDTTDSNGDADNSAAGAAVTPSSASVSISTVPAGVIATTSIGASGASLAGANSPSSSAQKSGAGRTTVGCAAGAMGVAGLALLLAL